MMKLKFNANQQYQLRAIESVVELFQGFPLLEPELHPFANVDTLTTFVIPNMLYGLDASKLLENLRGVQTRNEIVPDVELQMLEGNMESAGGTKKVSFPNFSVEMETGTGKTYVYIRTVLELCKRYGLRKFIIVVPSVAVREGVLKTLRVTESHLKAQYSNVPYHYFVYDSANPSGIRSFARSNTIEIMIMTIDSFKKADNVIHIPTDRLQGETPIHLIQTTRPILILDEPQNMESEASIAALAALHPLIALRYSATHRNPYNVVYRLTPYEAYRQHLVKGIEVAGMVKDEDANKVFLRLEELTSAKNTVTARIAVHKLMKTGKVQEVTVEVKPGISLYEKTNREDYQGYEVEEINVVGGFVRFANNLELRRGDSLGADRDAMFRAQIRYTIEEHFRKQQRLREAGIKVLSLFFIDRVNNYIGEESIIRRLFNEEFNRQKEAYPEWRELNAEDVQAAYFAQRRRTGGATEFVDTVSGRTLEDEVVFDLIMRDKETLLSFPHENDDLEIRRRKQVCFLFSHSALREGWDNPNVFQICTLNQTVSDIKKRQEVGRGVRLCVNQSGERIHDEPYNILTVVANDSYKGYVAGLQAEVEAEYGTGTKTPPVANASGKTTYQKRPGTVLTPEFQELWEQIKHKTRYTVIVNSQKLIADVVAGLSSVKVSPPQIVVTKGEVVVGQGDKGDKFDVRQLTATKVEQALQNDTLPNLLSLLENLMEQTTNPVRISRRTLWEILQQVPNKKAMLDNPFDFATQAVSVIKDKLADQLVGGIQYEKKGEWYEQSRLENMLQTSKPLVEAPHSVYDSVPCDSSIEEAFVRDLENRDDVLLYLKLPNWFKVDTPVGEYNPDWAVVMEERDGHSSPTGATLYMVAETKSSLDYAKLRSSEARKINCGRKHFQGALRVHYCVVTDAEKLPCTTIEYLSLEVPGKS
jgi:type III restriction enzyme